MRALAYAVGVCLSQVTVRRSCRSNISVLYFLE